MKKLIIMWAMALSVFGMSCKQQEVPTPTAEIQFTANAFGVESGQLKSFDIGDWKHFHSPYKVVVTMTDTVNDVDYQVTAPNSRIFFEDGTSTRRIPYGIYRCEVTGGGFPEGAGAYSCSFYMWSIKDTILTVDANSGVIQFKLDKKSALLVRDADVNIKLYDPTGVNDTLHWTGRGIYDFAYVTPWNYLGVYADEFGNKDSVAFSAEFDSYYYFITPNLTNETGIQVPQVPEFEGNELEFN